MVNQFSIRISTDFDEEYPDADATATECAMNLILTADLMTKRIAALLQPFDLSPASGLVLSMLVDSEEPLPPNKIAERLIISRASVTGLIDSLERHGYARRAPHEGDRRMLLVFPTESGRHVAQTFRPIVHRQQKMWLDALGEEDKVRLIDTLHTLQAVLTDSNV